MRKWTHGPKTSHLVRLVTEVFLGLDRRRAHEATEENKEMRIFSSCRSAPGSFDSLIPADSAPRSRFRLKPSPKPVVATRAWNRLWVSNCT